MLKGVEEISEIDAQLLEVFCSGVAIAFDNILLTQEITDTQAELILRLGDVVESRSNEAGNHVRRMSQVCHLLAQASGHAGRRNGGADARRADARHRQDRHAGRGAAQAGQADAGRVGNHEAAPDGRPVDPGRLARARS